MNGDNIIKQISNWISTHTHAFSVIVSFSFLILGILAVLGSILNWDWLYKPDVAYHNKWTIGQISRYLGRGSARVLGFIGGLILIFSGAVWSYMALVKK
ncbi:MAG TPA: Imm17 family immunity protein [Flavitalea sp.]|nr:Imm17 family immunity protein [Flavitalea sp.]